VADPAALRREARLWPTTEQDALAVQDRLARHRSDEPGVEFAEVRRVVGLDVSYSPDGRRLAAAAAAVDPGTLDLLDTAVVLDRPAFDYRPGLFAFRELPALLAALEALPGSGGPGEVYLCDGFGLAHPRRFGLACHLGVLLDRPAFGVAKTPLIGTGEEPGPNAGDFTALVDSGEVVGRRLRTVDGVRPVYVSVGHRIDLDTATALTGRLTPRYRVPEPVRHADRLSRAALRAEA
jgi:deoxyribonuclease V